MGTCLVSTVNEAKQAGSIETIKRSSYPSASSVVVIRVLTERTTETDALIRLTRDFCPLGWQLSIASKPV
jgi:hypothetical protein